MARRAIYSCYSCRRMRYYYAPFGRIVVLYPSVGWEGIRPRKRPFNILSYRRMLYYNAPKGRIVVLLPSIRGKGCIAPEGRFIACSLIVGGRTIMRPLGRIVVLYPTRKERYYKGPKGPSNACCCSRM